MGYPSSSVTYWESRYHAVSEQLDEQNMKIIELYTEGVRENA